MHVAKVHVQGNSLIGLYVVALDNIVLVGPEVPEHLEQTIKEVFKADILRLSIAGTSLLGIFAATNGTDLIVPHIIFESEEEILKKNNISYTKIYSHFTCHGNNVVASKKGVLTNPDYEPEALQQIEEAFSLPVKSVSIDGAPTIGSFIVCNDAYALVSHDVLQEELNTIQSHLGVQVTPGTVNMGATQISSGIALNNNGFLIGDQSGGPEIVNADEALGFLHDE